MDTLRQARDELEDRVSARTAQLARANEALRVDARQRERAERARTERLRKLVTAQEDERRRVSRELYDGLGQELTALILALKHLEGATPTHNAGQERLAEVEAMVARIGSEAHDLALELRPTALNDLGLSPALCAYVARWQGRIHVPIEFEAVGLEGRRLAPEIESTIYRVVQEALNNVAKHAGAQQSGALTPSPP